MYVSNVIADSFKIWHPGERILISAGYGTGKTSFAAGPLAKHAREHGKRDCAILNAVKAGVLYEDMILEALGLGYDTDRQGSEAEDRMNEARRWLELHAGQAVDTAELAEILATRPKGHRGCICVQMLLSPLSGRLISEGNYCL